MIKIALAAWLRLHNPTHDPHYTTADLVAASPYTLKDWEARLPLYSKEEFGKALDRETLIRCYMVRVSSDGAITIAPISNCEGR